MLQLNHCLFAGHVTRDPQVRFLAGDRTVANFGLAVSRRWKDAEGNQQEDTTFLDFEAWGRQAEFIGKFVRRGTPLYVQGRVRMDQWQDRETGKPRSRLSFVVEQVMFTGNKPADAKGPTAAERAAVAAVDENRAARPGAAPAELPDESQGVVVTDEPTPAERAAHAAQLADQPPF